MRTSPSIHSAVGLLGALLVVTGACNILAPAGAPIPDNGSGNGSGMDNGAGGDTASDVGADNGSGGGGDVDSDTGTVGDTGTDVGSDTGGGAGGTLALAVFADPDSDFTTTDVYDVNGDIVQFDTDTDSLVWKADGSEFAGYEVNGNALTSSGGFTVRFGTVSGEPRAFFTETGPGTICDIAVVQGQLGISPTAETVPHT